MLALTQVSQLEPSHSHKLIPILNQIIQRPLQSLLSTLIATSCAEIHTRVPRLVIPIAFHLRAHVSRTRIKIKEQVLSGVMISLAETRIRASSPNTHLKCEREHGLRGSGKSIK